MSDRTMTSVQQDELERLVDACGLDLVLGGLANICARKAGHLVSNWQDKAAAKAWLRAMSRIDNMSYHSSIEQVSA